MNKVAIPCCGSCKYFYYNKTVGGNCCHSKRAIMLYLTSFPERICAANYYKPRNPIPIIDLSGVKELIEAAYRAGYQEVLDLVKPTFSLYRDIKDFEDNYVYEYMKALEAEDE